jgi:hypothetical protein
LRVEHGRGIDGHLVGAGMQQPANILRECAHAAAHGQRDEHLGGHILDDVQDQVAVVGWR